MFESYTEKARRVIFFARYEASQFGASAIEAEHILLGLIREDKGLINRFFARPEGAVESVREEVERGTAVREKISTSADLPLSPTAKRVLGYAQEESERLGRRYVGTEHLLLGLLREERTHAEAILRERGVGLERVRQELERGASVAPEAARTDESRSAGAPVTRGLEEDTLFHTVFFRWSDAARQALFLARCEAGGVGDVRVLPEHLLLGVLRVDEAPAVATLGRLRERYAEIQAEVEASASGDPFPLLVRAPVAAATLRAIARANEECDRLGRERLEVEHLLLGLVAEGGERVAALLAANGVAAEAVRAEVDALGDDDDA